jgi:hypothetical protein
MAKVRKKATDQSNVNKLYRDRIAQGDENQREGFNAVRGTYALRPDGSKAYASKTGKAEVKKGMGSATERKYERAGGKGK